VTYGGAFLVRGSGIVQASFLLTQFLHAGDPRDSNTHLILRCLHGSQIPGLEPGRQKFSVTFSKEGYSRANQRMKSFTGSLLVVITVIVLSGPFIFIVEMVLP
jgi:hypothetical protein